MNKQECKKYLRRAYKRIIENNKSLNITNIEYEMKNVTEEQITEYITYSKIAIHNIQKSGNLEIKLKDLLSQIDVLPKIYSKDQAINIATKL